MACMLTSFFIDYILRNAKCWNIHIFADHALCITFLYRLHSLQCQMLKYSDLINLQIIARSWHFFLSTTHFAMPNDEIFWLLKCRLLHNTYVISLHIHFAKCWNIKTFYCILRTFLLTTFSSTTLYLRGWGWPQGSAALSSCASHWWQLTTWGAGCNYYRTIFAAYFLQIIFCIIQKLDLTNFLNLYCFINNVVAVAAGLTWLQLPPA